jgi:hypothetical protein
MLFLLVGITQKMQRRMVGNGESKWCKDESRGCKKVVKIPLGWVRNALTHSKRQSEDQCEATHWSKPDRFEDGLEFLPEGFLVMQKIVQS